MEKNKKYKHLQMSNLIAEKNSSYGDIQCPVCSECLEVSPFEGFRDYNLFLCRKCDLVFSHPMQTIRSDVFSRMYEDRGFYLGFATSLGIGHKRFFQKYKPPLKVLDVGCSVGLFPFMCQNKGFKVTGIEVDKKAVSLGRSLFPNVCLHTGDLTDFMKDESSEKFDIVTLFEVIEHIESPCKMLSMCCKALKPRGKVIIFVPNRLRTPKLYREMVDSGVDAPPHHLTKWSKKALKNLMNKAGLIDIKIESLGKYRHIWLPSFGFLSKIRNSILRDSLKRESSASPGGEMQEVDFSKYNMSAGNVYSFLASLKITIDRCLFWPADIYYKMKGFERDGLYAEGIWPN